MEIFRCLLIILAIPFVAFAAEINLPLDANGWTAFTPTAYGDAYATRILYVDPDDEDATGTIYNSTSFADPFAPSSTPDAYQTYAAAYAETRAGYPDWILIRRGKTLTTAIGTNLRQGHDEDEPFLIAAYGGSGASPIIKDDVTAINFSGYIFNYIAISGIDFYDSSRDPSSPDFVAGTTETSGIIANTYYTCTGMLIEGCKFRYFFNNMIQNLDTVNDVVDGITIRRCVFLDNYIDSHSVHSQGLYTSGLNGLRMTGCIFDHNGWLIQSTTNGAYGDGGQATEYNHNTYFTNATAFNVYENIFLRGSSQGNKWTSNDGFVASNITVNNNLYVDGEVGIGIGGNDTGPLRWSSISVTNNVLSNIGRSNATNREIAWYLDLSDWDGGTVSGNLLLDQPQSTFTNVYGIHFSAENQRNVSVTGNIIYNIAGGRSFWIDNSYDILASGMSFTNNTIQNPSNSGIIADTRYATSGKWSFSGNRYYSDDADGSRFYYVSGAVTNANWTANTGDSFTWGEVSFQDPTRDVDTYMASIGGTATVDGFIVAQRAQDRYSWDSRLEADTVNDWIRAGFGMSIAGASTMGGTGACSQSGPGAMRMQ